MVKINVFLSIFLLRCVFYSNIVNNFKEKYYVDLYIYEYFQYLLLIKKICRLFNLRRCMFLFKMY